MMTKKEIRSNLIARRKQMPMEDVRMKSSRICQKIMDSQWYQEAQVIYCYYSINNEVCLNELIIRSLSAGKTIALPKVKGNSIYFYVMTSPDDLEPGYFDIPEPKEDIPAPNGDLMIVPGVAFTKDGFRLGYGGGFYDRFLNCHTIRTIGVGYDFQILDEIPTEEHDRKMNKIISN